MFLGLDIGTSAVKALCLSGPRVTATASVDMATRSPRPGWSEQAPDLWWDSCCKALARLSAEVSLAEVQAIGLSGQMHGAVLLDRDHAVIRPAILWNDSRAAAECADLRAACPDIGTRAGVLPLPGFTAPKLMWLARHEPETYAHIAHVLLPKDYVGYRLHHQLATDRSDAAGTLWLNQQTRAWDPALADASRTDPGWLPPLFDGTEVVGHVTSDAAQQTGLPTGIPVVAGGGDAATGAVSLGATEPGRGFVSLGTSGQLFVADRVYRPNPDRFVHAFAHTLPDCWYQMAAMLNGARPISWIGGQLGLSPAEVIAEAERCDATRVPIFLPYLTGERSPHGDPDIRAGFFGLEDATTRAALCRAVVEAVAFTFADAADSFGEKMAEVPALAAIGGGSRSDLLLSLIAATTGKPVTRARGADAGPALGAAKLAACGVGALSLSDLAQEPEVDATFTPGTPPGLTERLQRYRALYQALKDLP